MKQESESTPIRVAGAVVACIVAIAATFGFVQFALAEGGTQLTTSPSSAVTSVAYLPDVTHAMTDASYWSEKQKDPDAVLADRDAIDQLNLAGVDADGTMLQPLKAAAERFYTAEEQERLKAGAATEMADVFVGQVYDEAGVLFTQEQADEILANYPTDGQAPNLASGYAIVTTHTTMRCYPSDRPLMYTLGDYDDDNLYLSALRVNEPLLVRAQSVDGKYLLCISSCMQASWVPAEDVAVCHSREEWLAAWDIPAGQELVVVGYKVRTEQSRVTPNVANRMLYMGTVLERVDGADPTELVGTRSSYNNHVCYLPVRGEDGTYSKELALIAESEDVSEGFLPLTKTNIAKVALHSLGQMYGWGGMLEANDCSGYVRDVYKCFGLELARNTTWQMNLPVRKYDLTGLDDAHKAAAIAQMPLGTVLFWGGHEMIYLGQENGKLYVISATGGIGNLFGESGTTQVKGVVINTLDMIRGNRNTWLQTLTTANVPYISNSVPGPGLHDMAFYENAVAWPDPSYAHTGSAIEPATTVSGLVAGQDYTVSYENNVDPGVATVTVSGAGEYTGTLSHNFTVEASAEPEPEPREIGTGLYVLLNYEPVAEGQDAVFTAQAGGLKDAAGLVYTWEESSDRETWTQVSSGESATWSVVSDKDHLGMFYRVRVAAPDGQTAVSNIQMLAAVAENALPDDAGDPNGSSSASASAAEMGESGDSSKADAGPASSQGSVASQGSGTPQGNEAQAGTQGAASQTTQAGTTSAATPRASSTQTSGTSSSAATEASTAQRSTSRTGDEAPMACIVVLMALAGAVSLYARHRKQS